MKIPFALSAVALAFTLSACGVAEEELTADDFYAEGKDDSVRAGRFETFVGRDGQHYFHLLAGNGQKVLHSEGYVSRQGAADGLDTVRFNGAIDTSYQLLQARDGQWYFNLLGGNWRVIATSELYVTKANAERGVRTAMGLVQSAAVPATTGARFEVFRGLDGRYYFHLRAQNGEIVLQSQGYSKRASAVSGTSSVRTNGADLARYQVRDAANGQSYFVLIASNGKIIGVSETYVSRSNADRGAQAVASLLREGTVAAAK